MKTEGKVVVFSARGGDASWLKESAIGAYSPKTEFCSSAFRTSKGCAFTYLADL
jgi:hypothetical protein